MNSDLALLAAIVDTSRPQAERLAALETVIEALPESHPYHSTPLWKLYDRIKRADETRPYLIGGRAVHLYVKRPPQCLADVL